MNGILPHHIRRIYVSGPLTTGNGSTAKNVTTALQTASELLTLGYAPYVPHLTHFWDMICPRENPRDWLCLDAVWLHFCEALLRLPGKSHGADIEVEIAKENGLPVYYEMATLLKHRPVYAAITRLELPETDDGPYRSTT